jgi:transposase
MNYRNFVGIDISKSWFDACFLKDDTPKVGDQERFSNDAAGIALFRRWMTGLCNGEISNTLVVMEHTGVYVIPLCQHLSEHLISYTIIAGIEILKSSGLTRGASDKIDAMRIAKYGFKNRDDIRICTLPSKKIAHLKRLLSYREQLVRQKTGLEVSVKETKEFNLLIDNEFFTKSAKPLVEQYEIEIKRVELEMKAVIKSDESLFKNYTILLSVPGIGLINAVAFLVYTGNFVTFTDSRKYACYCGIAPFPNGSGTKPGNKKVSKLANLRVKAWLSAAALTVITHNAEMKLYYKKHVALGKNKFLVKNNIRNKIVHQVFSLIRKGKLYENRHTYHTV